VVNGHTIPIVNVYLPCSTGSFDYETVINECVGFIENCMVCTDYDSVILTLTVIHSSRVVRPWPWPRGQIFWPWP